MSNVVLKDGRVINLSHEQSERLGLVILLSTDDDKQVKLGLNQFRLSDIVTDREEIAQIMQQKLLDVEPVTIQKNRKKKQELA